ncbi:hypothetical protein TNCV_4663221 [Trichonephila clavipes]|uniref:Uncharacterized protein n=1 Tax=Trichonephila clavipes TaxID=2585209 RepID=A0A8X6S9S8_TRICX|nr:hypothetical protein TNCV_4663221 [Trichonephila clavipes]
MESSDQPMRREHNKEDRFEPEEPGRNNSTDPIQSSKEGQAAEIPEAEMGKKTALSGEERRSKQQHIHFPGCPSRSHQLQVIKIRYYASLVSARELKEEKKDVVDCEAIRDKTIESWWIQFHTSYSRGIEDPRGL